MSSLLTTCRETSREVSIRSPRRGTMLLGWVTLAAIGGCGSPPAYQPPLEGVVLWDDGSEPRELEGGTIEFQTQGQIVARSGLVGDGTFMLSAPLPPGQYKVRLLPPQTSHATSSFDPRYQDFETSGLRYVAKDDPQPQRVTFRLSRRK